MNRLAPQRNLLLPLFFAVTLFVSAALLFLVQPMLAKMALPLLGGSPAVWNTCLVFFQAVLLAGYSYTHAVTRRLGARRQAALHLGLLLLPLLVLPIRIPPTWAPPAQQNPIPWLLTLLLMSVGLPFFMTLYPGANGRPLHTERSFFGVYRVTFDLEGNHRLLIHGSTIQGVQSLDPARQREPLSYYSRNGPIGQVFAAFSGTEIRRHVAVVGLGAGSLACYGEPVEQFTFYEIDPVVERIARDPHYFTFLRDCPPKIDVVLGDGRLSLRKAPDRHYGMIVLDAFSSDAIPMHLVTREAMELYLSKLAERGLLAFNVSNRYLDLRPVLGDLARDAGLVCLSQDDTSVSEAEIENGRFPSQWVVMARREGDLGKLVQDPRWMALPGRSGRQAWTDDFSNVLSIVRWGS